MKLCIVYSCSGVFPAGIDDLKNRHPMPARRRIREGIRKIGAKYISIFRALTDALRNALYVKVRLAAELFVFGLSCSRAAGLPVQPQAGAHPDGAAPQDDPAAGAQESYASAEDNHAHEHGPLAPVAVRIESSASQHVAERHSDQDAGRRRPGDDVTIMRNFMVTSLPHRVVSNVHVCFRLLKVLTQAQMEANLIRYGQFTPMRTHHMYGMHPVRASHPECSRRNAARVFTTL